MLYQTFDNLDGKQARRTNSSSPIGMILDHGCDAIAGFLISPCICRIFMI
jgi:ethanolaminephosphotransferase